MKSLAASLGQNISISSLAYLLIAILGIARSALLTKTLGIESFGMLLLVLNCISVFFLIFSLKLNDLSYRLLTDKGLRNIITENSIIFVLFILSALQALSLYLAALILYPVMLSGLFDSQLLESEIRLYLLAIPFMSFEGFLTVVLRLNNQYVAILWPRVFGVSVSVLIILASSYMGLLNIKMALYAFLAMLAVQTIIPFLSVLRIFINNRPCLADYYLGIAKHRDVWRSVKYALLGTSIGNYLKIFFNPGDIILLGLVASPAQVGIYGFAKTLVSPIHSIGSVLQTVYAPIISSFAMEKKFIAIRRLLIQNFLFFTILFSFSYMLFLVLGKDIILLVSSAEFLPSLSVVMILIFANSISFSLGNVLYPLVLARDRVMSLNVVYVLAIVTILLLAQFFQLDEIFFSFAQLLLATLTFLFYLYFWMRTAK
jgi:O-antigen/teichoic acid export membrane protein